MAYLVVSEPYPVVYDAECVDLVNKGLTLGVEVGSTEDLYHMEKTRRVILVKGTG